MNRKRKTTAAQQTRLLEGSRAIRTSLLSDALGKGGAMDHDMRCLSANCRMAGPAVTLRVHTADILMVGIALSQCPKGSVLVIDGQGELNTALWGEITTLSARLKGLQGVVIDGAIRDLYKIRRDKLPVFARAVVPNAGGAQYAGEINVPIQCGGAIVYPGDWIIGDEDGVVVVPRERLEMVIDAARRLAIVEKKIEKEVAKGKDLASLLRFHELLDRKAKEGALPQMRFEEK
jgi:3-hexulose-6-phosphate synthase/6-phospho-3-hexuloisomerase